MSGLGDNTTQAASLMTQVQSKITQLASTTVDPALVQRLTSLATNVGTGSTTVSTLGATAVESISDMFSPAHGATTNGMNMVLQCVCTGALDGITTDFMHNLGEVYSGSGVEKVVNKAQETLDFVNSISSITAQTVSELESAADSMIQEGVDTLKDVAGAVADATGITDVAREAVSYMGFMGTVMSSCIPKMDLFGIPSVKDMIGDINTNMGIALDLGLSNTNMSAATCDLLGKTGLADSASSLQDSMNERMTRLRG